MTYTRAALRFPLDGGGKPRFVLFGVGRSGSTLLSELLDAHTGIRCDGEILHEPVRFPRLQVVARESLSASDAYGFKLLCYQVRDVQRIRDVPRFLAWLHRRGYVLIQMKRQDRLRHALSNISARQHGFHNRGRYGGNRRMHIDLADLHRWLENAEREAAYAAQSIGELPHHDVTYECDLLDAASQRRTVDRICDLLGLPHEVTRTDLQPTNPERLSELIANYDEIHRALQDTRWSQFLDD